MQALVGVASPGTLEEHPPATGGETGLTATEEAKAILDHGKSTLARGSRWDYTPLPFWVGIPT